MTDSKKGIKNQNGVSVDINDNGSRKKDESERWEDKKKKKSDQLDANEMPMFRRVTSGEDSPVGLCFDT